MKEFSRSYCTSGKGFFFSRKKKYFRQSRGNKYELHLSLVFFATMPKLPCTAILKSLSPAHFASKRAKDILQPPLSPTMIRRLKRLQRTPRRLRPCPMDIDCPPLPDQMEMDDPWSPNLVTLDTNWVNDNLGGLVSLYYHYVI